MRLRRRVWVWPSSWDLPTLQPSGEAQHTAEQAKPEQARSKREREARGGDACGRRLAHAAEARFAAAVSAAVVSATLALDSDLAVEVHVLLGAAGSLFALSTRVDDELDDRELVAAGIHRLERDRPGLT